MAGLISLPTASSATRAIALASALAITFVAVMLRPARPPSSAAPTDEAAVADEIGEGREVVGPLTRSIGALTPSEWRSRMEVGDVLPGAVDRLGGAELTEALLVAGLRGRDHRRTATGGELRSCRAT
jgi:hypothetical protein